MKRLLLLPVLLAAVACAEKTVSLKPDKPVSTKIPFFMTRPQAMTPVELVFDKDHATSKPGNYRKNESLQMSGSASFATKALKEIAKPVKKNKATLYVFDLRQESHGLINDIPVTWTADREWANAEMNHEEAVRRERRLLGDLRVGEKVGNTTIQSIETEESLVRTGGHQYVRLTVTDHVRPVDSEVDRFIEAIRGMPDKAWAHFHCRSGKGRSTVFMIMYDMLRNAGTETYETIIKRNTELSQDFDVLTVPTDEKDWKHPFQKETVAFITEFYNYAKAHPNGEGVLWGEWVLR